MSGYKLWLRVSEVAHQHFEATVICLPDVSGNVRHEAETRLLPSRPLAVQALAEMAEHARERILKRGDFITRMESI